MAEICQESRASYEAHKQKWGEKRERFKRIPMMQRDRDNLLMDLRMREREELDKIRSETTGRRDTGKTINFSHHNERAKELAAKLAQARWGKNVMLDSGVLKPKAPAYTPPRSPSNDL